LTMRARPVYTINMKNITLSVNEEDLKKARSIARQRNTTLNTMFREWVKDITQTKDYNAELRLRSLWRDTDYLVVGKKLTREDLHRR
jgi:hypothetical protein